LSLRLRLGIPLELLGCRRPIDQLSTALRKAAITGRADLEYPGSFRVNPRRRGPNSGEELILLMGWAYPTTD
jgi:hypothetical protein